LCTRDLCCSDNGCYYAPICCDDNNACTIDSCDPYNGCQNVKISCDDGDECTIDRCHCDHGCEHFPVDPRDNSACKDWEAPVCSSDAECADSNQCTENHCTEGSCHVTAVDCDDDNSCTIDSCHPETGCDNVQIIGCGEEFGDAVFSDDDPQTEHLNEEKTKEMPINNDTKTASNAMGAGPIAGIVAGVVALIAVMGMIGYKLTRNSSPDNAYKAM